MSASSAAGLAGLTVAREVARRGWSVAVLEAGRVAWAASGRNTGFVLPGFAREHRQHGRARRPRPRQGALGAVGAGRRLRAPRHRRDRHAGRRSGAGLAARFQDRQRRRRSAPRSSGCAGSAPMSRAGRPSACARCCPTRAISARCIFRRAFHIHPLNYALGLAADAEKARRAHFRGHAGARRSIRPACASASTRRTARVRAAHVVLAGNVHLGALMPRLAATLLPITTYVMVTEPLGPRLARGDRAIAARSATPTAPTITTASSAANPRCMWSGRMRAWEADPRCYRARAGRATSSAIIPQLGEVEVAHLWRGTLGRTVHRMPQIGEIEPRRLAGERLRRPRPQHHGDGRRI